MTTYDPFDYNCQVIANGGSKGENFIMDTILFDKYTKGDTEIKSKIDKKISELEVKDSKSITDTKNSNKYANTFFNVDFTSKKKYSSRSIIQVIFRDNHNILESHLKTYNISYKKQDSLISINFKENQSVRILFWNDKFMDVFFYFNPNAKLRSVQSFCDIYLLVDTTKMIGDGIKILDLDGYGTRLDIINKNYKQNLLNNTSTTTVSTTENININNINVDTTNDPLDIKDDLKKGGSKKTKKTKKQKNKKTKKQKKQK